MFAQLLTMPEMVKLPPPKIDDFLGKAGFDKYSNSIWYCIYEIVEKDVQMMGEYGRSYDQKLVDRINATQQLIMAFRRYGMISVNIEVQKRLKLLLGNMNL